MPDIPQVAGSSGSSVAFITFAVIIVGTLIAFIAIPHVRSRAKEHAKAPQQYFFGDKTPVDKPSELSQDADSTVKDPGAPPRRREIEEFDLSIFEED